MSLVIKLYQESLQILKKSPKLFIPFILSAVLNLLALYFLYLAPIKPVSFLLAPPIRAFFGEKFLHYPFCIFLLPKIFYYAQVVISASIGLIISALAIGLIKDIYLKNKLNVKVNLVTSFKKYFVLLGIWVIMFLASFYSAKLIALLFKNSNLRLLMSILAYLVAIGTQVFFIYAIPIAVIKNKGLIAALKESFLLLKKLFLITIILVILPALTYLLVVVFNNYLPQLITKLFPEVVIISLLLGIVITFIMDVLLTLAPTLVVLKEGKDIP